MNLRFVEAFHWAATLQSITRAAERLHITQSAMSSRIAALEAELCTVLFDRRGRQLRLTAAGLRFQRFAVRLLDLQRQARQELGAAGAAPLLLRIGAIESVVHSWLPDWLQRMRESHAGFELELTVETTPALVDQMRRGAQDLVFTAVAGAGAGVRSMTMPSMEMTLVGHRDHYPARRRYTLAELSAQEMITFQRGSQPHQALFRLFRDAGIAAPRVHAVSSISAMLRLVEGGFGIGMLPREVFIDRAGAAATPRPPLRLLSCAVPLPSLPVHASWRDDPGSDVAEAAVDAALDFLGQRSRSTPRAKP